MKFQQYRTIESLQEYVLIAQDKQHIERYARHERSQWILAEAIGPSATLSLASIGATLHLIDVYEQVALLDEPETKLPRDVPPHSDDAGELWRSRVATLSKYSNPI
jgi:hypothetical protein